MEAAAKFSLSRQPAALAQPHQKNFPTTPRLLCRDGRSYIQNRIRLAPTQRSRVRLPK